MADYQIPISYVVSASLVSSNQGLEPLKMSTILLLTDEEPVVELSGDYGIYRTANAVIKQWGTDSTVSKMANAIFSQQPNLLANDGYVIVAPYTSSEETTSSAVTRLAGLLYFNGILTARDIATSEAVATAQTVEAMTPHRIFFCESNTTDSLQASTGLFAQIQNNVYTKTLLYTKGNSRLNSKLFASAYASRLFAVNYSGSNTCITMNLKDLSGIEADTNISETILNQCVGLGVDVFPSVEGLAKVLSKKKAGVFIDQVQNQLWFVNAIQRNVFNLLATTRTKIPQTEQGMQLKTNSIADICKQGITNGFLAPGKWNSADTFGVLEDFTRNITENGYYIYHLPISQQLQAEREQRKAPVFQIAAKEAGAVHSANILIYVEA